MSFRIQSKEFFLTYPQSNFDLDDYLAHACTLGASFVLVSHELHDNGEPHRHAYIKFDNRKDIRSNTYFDFDNRHANIQRVKSTRHCIEYCIKGGEYIWWPEDCDIEDHLGSTKALDPASCDTEEEWLARCLANRTPYGYANRLWILSRRDRGDCITEESEGVVSTAVAAIEWSDSHYSTVLVGPSGIGKTTWCINTCIKPALLCTHMDELRKFDPEYHRSIIFDDMDFSHMPDTAQIHIVDHDLPRAIHARYGNARIPAKTYKFFTCNKRPFVYNDAINRRINLYEF